MKRSQRHHPKTETGWWSKITAWWLRSQGQPPLSADERRTADLTLVAKHLAVLERLEANAAALPSGTIPNLGLEREAILLERAAMAAGDDEAGEDIVELRRRETLSAADLIPRRQLPSKALFALFDPACWFPPGEARIAVEPPPATAPSLLECHRHMNRQFRAWLDARWRCSRKQNFDAVTAGRAHLLERIRLYARLDKSTPPEALASLDEAILEVRGMAHAGGCLTEGIKKSVRNLLGDPLHFETSGAVVGQYRVIAAALADNEQWLRLLRDAWSRSPAPEMLLAALKDELRHGARLPEGFEERLATTMTEWKKP